MSDVFLGAGNATGMFYRAPRGTALPSYPGAALGADWELVADVGEDGLSLKLPSGDVIRNWAMVAKRKVNTENGVLTVPVLDTTKKALEALFGDDNVDYLAATSQHGNVTSVDFGIDVSADPAAYLFLMKDGDTLAYVGSSDALITEIADISFKATDPAMWTAQIDGTWKFMIDDGDVTS
ncbi:MAG: hypothetical protein IIY21_12850 [Clostridiales bacterium]|nr:hypothetical protein [Clostridiales bacterium]